MNFKVCNTTVGDCVCTYADYIPLFKQVKYIVSVSEDLVEGSFTHVQDVLLYMCYILCIQVTYLVLIGLLASL
jgi:hypothetical protein